jgi:hypothetical protein
MYAETAHQSLDDIRAFMDTHKIKAPLFADLSTRSDKPSPKICIGIQTANRAASPINYLE